MCRICTNAIIHSKNFNSVIIYLPSCCSQMYMLFFSQWNAKGEFFINLHEALFHNVTICNDLSSSKRTKTNNKSSLCDLCAIFQVL